MQKNCDVIFEALADEIRRDILLHLKDSELCAAEVHAKFISSRTAISYHLSLLLRAGLIKARKEGRNIYYSLNPDILYKQFSNIIHKLIYSNNS